MLIPQILAKAVELEIVEQFPVVGLLDEPFALGQVEEFLFSLDRFPRNAVLAVNAPNAAEDLEGLAFPDAMRSFGKGHTLILRSLHRRIPFVAKLAGDLGHRLGAEIRVNCYITPQHARGFKRHFDSHDVLIIQTYGEKQWNISSRIDPIPVETTLMSDLQKGLVNASAFQSSQCIDESHELQSRLLRCGEGLFLPRGVPHEGKTSERASIHLSLALISPTVAEAAAMTALITGLSSPPGRRTHGVGRTTALPHRETSGCELEAILEISRQRARLPVPGRYLESLSSLESFEESTEVEWRPNIEPWIGDWSGGSAIVFSDQIVPISDDFAAAWRFVGTTRQFRVCALPLDDGNSRILFVQELVRLGLLQLPNPKSHSND